MWNWMLVSVVGWWCENRIYIHRRQQHRSVLQLVTSLVHHPVDQYFDTSHTPARRSTKWKNTLFFLQHFNVSSAQRHSDVRTYRNGRFSSNALHMSVCVCICIWCFYRSYFFDEQISLDIRILTILYYTIHTIYSHRQIRIKHYGIRTHCESKWMWMSFILYHTFDFLYC